ncbi:hypothetical protein K435DRAFT_814380 [Dendrothele bispora CBS 962.96]|uniref:Uncharacterized protein n=1 Tax=Dendrothele bispora (strain CBS 962.96) TaxID=1314807 RepID=A0A4S8KJ77_DENBC|nr:hypothetical protein K435DRAFT_814380 [Dendrothele bispora CBS 962.96]
MPAKIGGRPLDLPRCFFAQFLRLFQVLADPETFTGTLTPLIVTINLISNLFGHLVFCLQLSTLHLAFREVLPHYGNKNRSPSRLRVFPKTIDYTPTELYVVIWVTTTTTGYGAGTENRDRVINISIIKGVMNMNGRDVTLIPQERVQKHQYHSTHTTTQLPHGQKKEGNHYHQNGEGEEELTEVT